MAAVVEIPYGFRNLATLDSTSATEFQSRLSEVPLEYKQGDELEDTTVRNLIALFKETNILRDEVEVKLDEPDEMERFLQGMGAEIKSQPARFSNISHTSDTGIDIEIFSPEDPYPNPDISDVGFKIRANPQLNGELIAFSVESVDGIHLAFYPLQKQFEAQYDHYAGALGTLQDDLSRGSLLKVSLPQTIIPNGSLNHPAIEAAIIHDLKHARRWGSAGVFVYEAAPFDIKAWNEFRIRNGDLLSPAVLKAINVMEERYERWAAPDY